MFLTNNENTIYNLIFYCKYEYKDRILISKVSALAIYGWFSIKPYGNINKGMILKTDENGEFYHEDY